MNNTQTKEVCGSVMAYRPGTPDEVILRQSFDKDPFLPEMPQYSPEPGHTVVEVGAHIGSFSVHVSKMTNPGRYFAIEACAESFALLERNLKENGCSNAKCFKMAISGENGTCRLYHNGTHGNWGHSVVNRVGDAYEDVPSCTLESFFDSHGIDSCDLLKMNCEGSEFPILMNLPESAARKIKNVTLEFHCHLWPGNTKEDLVRRLESFGFRCEIRHYDGVNGWIVASREERSL